MHCYDSYMGELGMAAVVFLSAGMSILSKGMEASRMLSVVSAVAGVFIILLPSSLIGVCANPKMPCHYGLMPVWNLVGVGVVILSAVMFFVAREEPV